MTALEKSKSIEAELQSICYEGTEEQNEIKGLPNKFKTVFSNITVEPIMIFYVWPSVMSSLAVQNLNLEKTCRVNLNFTSDTCDALAVRNRSGFTEFEEQSVQKMVASLNAYKNLIQSVLPALLLLFLGSWSDRHQRRKPIIMMPVLGDIIATLGFLISVYFFYQLPAQFNCAMEAIPPALTGGWFAMFMGVFSYISHISSVETRTLRIGAVNMIFNISLTVGIAMSGIMYHKIGFYGVFGLSLSMYLTGLMYAIFRVKERPASKEQERKKVGFCRDFFNWNHIKDTFRVAFKKGKRNRRRKICTIMVLVMVIIGPLHGEMNVMYLFVRYKFGWNEMDFSIYSTYNFVAHMAGTLFSLLFFSKFLKLDDALLGMISSISKVASSFVYAFAPNTTVFYIAVLVEILNGTSFIAMRSIVSKLVSPDELGKINSLFGVSEALMPLVYGPMYSIVYTKMIDVLPGAFFLLGGILTIPAVVIFFWLYTQHKKDAKDAALEKDTTEEFLKKEPADVEEKT